MAYAVEAERTIPQAILASYTTITMIGIMVMVSGSGITTSSELLNSEAPLMDGIDEVYGPDNFFSNFLAYVIVVGLVVNFFAFVLFCSSQIQAIAEAGQLPSFLAYRHPVHGAPIYASICSSIVGVLLTSGFALIFGEAGAQNTLVTAALMPAVIGYALLLECIKRVRSVEYLEQFQKLSPRDIVRKGQDPGSLRFYYGSIGATIAQLMCFTLAVGLLVLASVSIDFFYGLVLLAVLGALMYGVMYYYIRTAGESPEIDAVINIYQPVKHVDDPYQANYNSLHQDDRPFQFSSESNGNFNRNSSTNLPIKKTPSLVSMATSTILSQSDEERSPLRGSKRASNNPQKSGSPSSYNRRNDK